MSTDRRIEATTWTVTAKRPGGDVPVPFFDPEALHSYCDSLAEQGVCFQVREVHRVTVDRLILLAGVPQGGAR